MQITHGLAETLEQLAAEPGPRRRARVPRRPAQPRRARRRAARRRPRRACRSATRAAAPAASATFALFGETTGETDEFGLPVRGDWAADYRGARDRRLRPHAGRRARVGQQHDQHRHRLRLRRPPDRAALARARAGLACPRPASTTRPARPFLVAPEERPERLLDVDDVAGKRIVQTRLARTRDGPRGARRGRDGGHEPLRDRPALARLPAADDGADRDLRSARARSSTPPRRSPSSAPRASAQVVCEEKHMGSRAIAVVCRDEDVGARAFRRRRRRGAVYTRTGRPFLDDAEPALERIARRRHAPPGCGSSWRPAGSCSTARSCRGRRRRRS